MQSLDHLKNNALKIPRARAGGVAINFDEDRAALESVVKSKDFPGRKIVRGA